MTTTTCTNIIQWKEVKIETNHEYRTNKTKRTQFNVANVLKGMIQAQRL
jgi:hypothetical protein